MFQQVLLPLLNLLKAAFFVKDPGLKRIAGVAFGCFVVNVVLVVYTVWVAQPAYENIIHHELAGWCIAGAIGLLVFMLANTIGAFFAEAILGTKHLVEPTMVMIVGLLLFTFGIYDAKRGYDVGSVSRAEELFKAQSYAEANTTPLPYSKEIADLDKQIEALRNEKIMWRGRLTMPERNRKMIASLIKQKQPFIDLQIAAEKDKILIHEKRESRKSVMKSDSEEGNKMLNIWMYILMIPISILLQVFVIKIDIADGIRDGRYNANIIDESNPYDLPEKDSNNRKPSQMPKGSEKGQKTGPRTVGGMLGRAIFSMLGFTQDSSLEPDKFLEKFPDEASRGRFLKKYEHVIPDIRLKTKEIKQKHKIGGSTVQNIRRILRERGELENFEDIKT